MRSNGGAERLNESLERLASPWQLVHSVDSVTTSSASPCVSKQAGGNAAKNAAESTEAPSDSAPRREGALRLRRRREPSAMAVPAHLRVLSAAALPALRMGVAAVGADLVAADAVRERTGFVTTRARQNVAARRRPVK